MDVPSKVMPDSQGIDSEVVKPQAGDRSEPEKTQVPQEKVIETALPKATQRGEQTPDNRQEAAFLEERRMRKELEVRNAELEARLNQVKVSTPEINEEDLSDEGAVLARKISSLESELSALKEGNTIEQLAVTFPALKGSTEEFNEFRKDYPGVALDKVAKLFMAEKGLGTPDAARKGLERPSGGAKMSPGPSLSEDDVKRLRETQPRKYIKMLREGKLNPDDIKV